MRNKERRKAYDKAYRETHKAEAAKYAANHIEEKRLYDKKYRESHREQDRIRGTAWVRAHRREITQRHKRSRLKRKYNMTVEDYDRMFEKQNGRCAICGKHESEFNRMLCVDHDHTTGKVRGLLCHKCNSAIGLLTDNPIVLKQAWDYMRGGASLKSILGE